VTNESEIEQECRAFASNFREARIQADLTQEEIANITGLTQAFISKMENDETSVSLPNAIRLAAAVNKPICKLLKPAEK
jgi:transcriptional regulator with XRE-family HTH domain